jgi:TonB dependent receptor/Carboxypeptidase regulatory-like domain/TonB-dependent Receptor Plug Domain
MFSLTRPSFGRAAWSLGSLAAVMLIGAPVSAQDAGAATVDPDAGIVADPDAGVAAAPDAGEPVAAPVPQAQPEAAPAQPEAPAVDTTTGIQGRIVDAKTGLGIDFATVIAAGKNGTQTASAGEHGSYQLHVPPGVYTVRAFFDLYHGARLGDVRVQRNRLADVNLRLDPIDESDDVVVEEIEIPYRADTTTAAAQDELRKASSGIGEGMGAQQMSQSGAGDAGSAAKRVVGVSVDGSNLVIRGLSGRYVKVYLNGDPLPATDPDRPSVDLDLFPTNIIDSLTVSKTFLPNMPADFAGGVLEIRTVTFPKEFTLEIGASAEYSSTTTFRDVLTYYGGSHDFLGYDDGTRALPKAIPNESVRLTRNGNIQSFEELDELGRAFPNRWEYYRRTALPNPGLEITMGDSFTLGGGNRLGYMVSTSYDYEVQRKVAFSRKVGLDGADADTANEITSDYPDVEVGSEEVQLGGIATVSADLGLDHSLTALSLFNRAATDEVGVRGGINGEVNSADPVRRSQLQYVGRTLLFNQLLGDHRNLAGTRLRLRWSGYYALVERDEPDRREISYLEQGTGDERAFIWRTGSASRLYSNLTGDDVGGGLSLRFPLWTEAWGTTGGSVRGSNREFGVRTFRFVRPSGAPGNEAYSAEPSELFSDEGIGTLTRLDAEATGARDGFGATQTVYTGYGMVETPLVGPLSLTTGARVEAYEQRMEARSPFPSKPDDPPPEKADRSDLNVLPAGALKYDLGHDMLLRAAYGMTVGRPHARELAPYIYYDFLRDRNIVGNLKLRTTLIHNVDLRWEWFFAKAQILAATLFYKDFRRPIEEQIVSVDGTSTFTNTPSAQAYGTEIEFRANLKPISRGLRNFDFGSNLTLTQSVVEIPESLSGAVRAGDRRMFGQAPYVINMSLRFSDPVTHVAVGLVYNVVGPRIVDVGTRLGDGFVPDTEEQPFHALDLVSSWSPSEHVKLKLKWKNMLLQKKSYEQGEVEVLRADEGTAVSVGFDYSY